MMTQDPYQLIGNYRTIPGVYDELYDADGQIRNKYKFLVKSFQELGPTELVNRRRDTDRILRENGVTYNLYQTDSPEAKERPWDLDLFPLVMESEEWRLLERGLNQRADLLDALVRDVYSKRRLLHEKKIPPEILFNETSFLRACDGMYDSNHFLAKNPALLFFVCDLIRAADGNFYVLNDRVQAPSGSGYSLENRIVLSRIFPSMYRDAMVHRVAVYFRSLRKSLTQLAGVTGREPVIVLLTPGPSNETYFEHAYLAGYLGYTLVQGGDLTVRKNKVYMKTVEGLQQIDLIFRRVDDNFMDPLELRGDSLLGVPGLLESVRSGNVKIANPIGTGFLENRALLPFYSDLCRFYLGEDLILPMAPTYWMGTPHHFQLVLQNPEKYVFKTVSRTDEEKPVTFIELSGDRKDSFLHKLKLSPNRFIAQEMIASATVPVLGENGFRPGRAIMRTFVSSSGSGYQTMAGGLVRVSPSLDDFFITSQRGAWSKDLWVLATETQKEESLLVPKSDQVLISRKSAGVPSRVADNLFWLARYLERSENQTRVIREATFKILQIEDGYERESLENSLKLVTHVTNSYPGFIGDDASELFLNPFPELQRLTSDRQVVGSLAFHLRSLVIASKSVRDRLSEDMKKILLQLEDQSNHEIESYDQIIDFLQKIIVNLSSLTGLSFENMSREAGWYFLNLGRRIERSINMILMLQGMIRWDSFRDKASFETFLRINDIRLTYNRRYSGKIDQESVLDILLFDTTNPRSFAYQLEQINSDIQFLPGKDEKVVYSEDRAALQLYTHFKMKDISIFFESENPLESVSIWLEELHIYLKQLSESLSARYFNYTEEQTRIGDGNG
ncbi:circularly permuted type 2 ATP-grasp protein [Leptospira vanthielii]|uniref:Carboxylate--amine ligase n=2 Tax=Leptospira vanthielii TaxID=293085 RepID=A0ABY2NUE4_9LEPT|nr:circularly permuted type 2 ATP-grasp protein [Leptospira vanthielii]EMY71826.1 circularly permuted ATPgrasp domain protein [Leptospira vanthielii serovar Holland str. Waz Holland = ATCC 700522]TGM61773.1 carboxylate--amine ligase [Leptospira vanthielii]